MSKIYLCLDNDNAGKIATFKAIEKLQGIKGIPGRDIVIVEGQMDCIKLHQEGFKNVVAIQGSTLTDEMVSQISALIGGDEDNMDCSIEDALFYIELEKEWKKMYEGVDFVKAILGNSNKMEKRQIKLQVSEVADYHPQLWSKVNYLVPDNTYGGYLTQDIRDKMKEIPLKEFIEGQWSQRFHMNGCRCKFPDHKDKTASFHIYPITNTFYCFGCHAGGSLIDFLMTNDKIDVKRAISIIKSM